MNKEDLQARLKEIEQAIPQVIANLNMLEGRKQEILFIMENMDKLPQEEKPQE